MDHGHHCEDLVERIAVDKYIMAEFENRNIAVLPMVGLLVFKDQSATELQKTLFALEPQVAKSPPPSQKDIMNFVLEFGRGWPFFLWSTDNILSVNYNGRSSMGLECPLFCQWLDAVIQHVVEHDSLNDFKFQPK